MAKDPTPLYIALGFLVVAVACAVGGGLLYHWQSAQTAWPTAKGRIQVSEVQPYLSSNSRGARTQMYRARVEFTYEVLGKEFRSDRISSGSYGTSDRGEIEEWIKTWPVDGTVTVHYDPTAPTEGYLEVGPTLLLLIPAGLGVVFGGLGALLLVLRARGSL